MKSINIKREEKTENTSSLPIMLKLVQYGSTDSNHNNAVVRSEIGNSSYSFSIDCLHKNTFSKSLINNKIEYSIFNGNDGENMAFKYINILFKKYNNPTIPRKDLFARFSIFEIPDYGSQAMSKWYNDFIVHCYTEDGYKIPSQDVGIIRHYTSKIAYILIPRNLYSTSTLTLNMRVIFKVNIERNQENSLIRKNQEDFAVASENIYNAELSDSGVFYPLNLNSNYFLNLNFNKNFGENDQVGLLTQTGLEISDLTKPEAYTDDYYRQTFRNDYILTSNQAADRVIKRFPKQTLTVNSYIKNKNSIKSTLTSLDSSSIVSRLFSRQHYYEQIYRKVKDGKITFGETENDYYFTDPFEFSIYSLDSETNLLKRLTLGYDYICIFNDTKNVITSIEFIGSQDSIVEIIPEFYHCRKVEMQFNIPTSGNFSFRKVLNDKKIYRWNIESSCENYIFKNGLLQYGVNPLESTISTASGDKLDVCFYDRPFEDYLDTSITLGSSVAYEEPPVILKNQNDVSLKLNNNKYTIITDPQINTFSDDITNLNYYYLFDNDDKGYLKGGNELYINRTPDNTIVEINDVNIYKDDNDDSTSIENQVKELSNNISNDISSLNTTLNGLFNSVDYRIQTIKNNMLKFVDNSRITLQKLNNTVNEIPVNANDEFMFIYLESDYEYNDIEVILRNPEEIIRCEYNVKFTPYQNKYRYILLQDWNPKKNVYIKLNNGLNSEYKNTAEYKFYIMK